MEYLYQFSSVLTYFHITKIYHELYPTSSQHNSELFYWHKHCVELLKPSTLIHIAEKFLQLAATNCTDAGHSNTLLILQL